MDGWMDGGMGRPVCTLEAGGVAVRHILRIGRARDFPFHSPKRSRLVFGWKEERTSFTYLRTPMIATLEHIPVSTCIVLQWVKEERG